MLHLISQSPLEPSVLARIGIEDALVFLENAVLRLLNTGADYNTLAQLLESHALYVLADDLAVRGIAAEELVSGIHIINYSELVALTVQHSIIQSWS